MSNAFQKLTAILLALLMLFMYTTALAEEESIHIYLAHEGDIYYGDVVTLCATVENIAAGYTILWEMNLSGQWVQVGSGKSHSFTVDQQTAEAQFRAVLVIAE